MKTASLAPKTEAEIWLRILHPDMELSPQVARAILRLSFPEADLTRMHELSAKARAGALSPEEDAEMDNFERVGSILSTLKSKARQALKRKEEPSYQGTFSSARRHVLVQQLLYVDLGKLGNRTGSEAAADQRIFDESLGGSNGVRTPTWFDNGEVLSGNLF